jgi:hypothetical protein
MLKLKKRDDQFIVRLPFGLRDALKRLADENNRSMNSELIHLLQRELKKTTATKSLAQIIRERMAVNGIVGVELNIEPREAMPTAVNFK